MTVLMKGQ